MLFIKVAFGSHVYCLIHCYKRLNHTQIQQLNRRLDQHGLRHGSKTIENYTVEFCTLVNSLTWKYTVLKGFYCYGLNKPIKSLLPKGMNALTLEQYIDHALLLCCSSFTVGVEEDPSSKSFFGRGHHAPSSHDHRAWPIIVTSMSSDNGR